MTLYSLYMSSKCRHDDISQEKYGLFLLKTGRTKVRPISYNEELEARLNKEEPSEFCLLGLPNYVRCTRIIQNLNVNRMLEMYQCSSYNYINISHFTNGII